MQMHLSPETTATLQVFARHNQVTLNTIVQGAWALLMSAYNNEKDIVFGVTVSGRPAELSGVEDIVGLFINTIPFRVQVDPTRHLSEWMHEIQQNFSHLTQYEYTPLVQVQEWSELPNEIPLFETLMVFENYPLEDTLEEQESHLDVQGEHLSGRTNYPITLVVMPGASLELRMVYDAYRYAPEIIEQLLTRLCYVLEQMTDDGVHRLVDVSMLNTSERNQVLYEWNQTATDYVPKTIADLFAEQVAKTPQAPALWFENTTITYQELDTQSNQLAHFLQQQDVGTEVCVAICAERTPAMIVGILAIIKAGGAYLPLDPTYPTERLQFMLEDSQAAVLLIQKELIDTVALKQTRVIELQDALRRSMNEMTTTCESTVIPESWAYLIYTSGSTGLPKGVVLSHRGVGNMTRAEHRYLGIDNTSRVLQFAAFGFDASVFEIFGALLNGATLYLPSERLLDSELLLGLLRDQAITTATLPPSLLAVLPFIELPALQTLTVAGEACSSDLVDRWGNGRRFINAYGPTETTVWATQAHCAPQSGTPTIGTPIDNTQIYILDTAYEPVLIGTAGELCIGGVGLARGYLDRPVLTAERFIPDPSGGRPGMRLYRTGDLARHQESGHIEFLGRIDYQVKVRGYRIELGEIEAVLNQHPDIQTSVVLVDDDDNNTKRLVAYVVPQTDTSSHGIYTDSNQQDGNHTTDDVEMQLIAAVRDFAQVRLPGYMIPNETIVLPSLPLTPSGKIDRRALLQLAKQDRGRQTEYTAPRTPTEEMLVHIWSNVLGVVDISVYDNFFELGGQSLLAIQIVARMNDEFQLKIPLRSLFERLTIAAVAEYIDALRWATQHSDIEPATDENFEEGEI
ncbi:MAG: amino acid adenylation domain-containing protein [Blastochloris sp.]|nr:amino acid adenylation domain-containing protein [Blastochloris sp.]